MSENRQWGPSAPHGPREAGRFQRLKPSGRYDSLLKGLWGVRVAGWKAGRLLEPSVGRGFGLRVAGWKAGRLLEPSVGRRFRGRPLCLEVGWCPTGLSELISEPPIVVRIFFQTTPNHSKPFQTTPNHSKPLKPHLVWFEWFQMWFEWFRIFSDVVWVVQEIFRLGPAVWKSEIGVWTLYG